MTKPGLGRFEGNNSLEVSEYLFDIDPNRETGSIPEWGYWYGLILRADMDMKFLDKPAYIIWTDERGFCSYSEYDDVARAEMEFKQIEEDYTEFMEEKNGAYVS